MTSHYAGNEAGLRMANSSEPGSVIGLQDPLLQCWEGGILAVMEPVWNSLIRQGTNWKKWTTQNRDGCGGWGQGERLLLCNWGELQTPNVEWHSRVAVVYQTTLVDCGSQTLSWTLAVKAVRAWYSVQRRSCTVDVRAISRSYFWPHFQTFSTALWSNFKKWNQNSSQL